MTSTFRPVTAAGVSSFKPVTGWRWWLHLGHNETRLMHPRKPLPAFAVEWNNAMQAIGEAARRCGQSLAAFTEAWAKAVGQ